MSLMGATYNDSGIILRRTDIRDNDRILTILTRNHGKISAIARGLRKPTAKLAAHLDLFAIAQMSFATGYNLEVLTGAVRQSDSYFSDGLESLAYASLLAEIVDRTTESSAPVPELYDLLAQAFQDIAHSPSRQLVLWHLYSLLDWMGHAPLLDKCAQCGSDLPALALAFSASEGGFFCPDHSSTRLLLSTSTRPLLSLLAQRDRDFLAAQIRR